MSRRQDKSPYGLLNPISQRGCNPRFISRFDLSDVPALRPALAIRMGEDCTLTPDELLEADRTIEAARAVLRRKYQQFDAEISEGTIWRRQREDRGGYGSDDGGDED